MIEAVSLYKTYNGGEKEVHVLKGLSFSCGEGEFAGIFGASGSGKSTLLHILGGLDAPNSGTIKFSGADIYKMNEKALSGYRNKTIGFVFQSYHLLPEFSAVENAMLPCLIAGISKKEAFSRALSAIELVGLKERADHRPSELSGGESQRTAIARAIVMNPKFILADEPTGNLDESTGMNVFSYLERLNKELKTGIIMVTHNPELLKRIPRKLELKNGILLVV